MKSLIQSIIDQLETYQQKRRLRRAIGRAYAAFSRQYPRWAASLFDKHFLVYGPISILSCYLEKQTLPKPAVLAEAYLAMVGGQKMMQPHYRARVLPVANAFIQLMNAEIRS